MQSRYDEFKERVLIVLVGMAPAVLTETIDALTQTDESDRFIPTVLKVITTGLGRKRVLSELLDRQAVTRRTGGTHSRFDDMCANLPGVPRIPFGEADLLVPLDDEDQPYEDAHSEAELDAMSDLILQTLRDYTCKDEAIVFFSLSGGRKSMSHFAGQAMTAAARPRDRLLHVIVEPSILERCPDFYFRDSRALHFDATDEDGLPAQVPNGKNIALRLSHQPLLLLPDSVRQQADPKSELPFRELLTALTEIYDPARTLRLIIHIKEGKALIEGTLLMKSEGRKSPVRIPREEFVYLVTLAQRGSLQNPPTDVETLELLKNWERVAPAFGHPDVDAGLRAIECEKDFHLKSGVSKTLTRFEEWPSAFIGIDAAPGDAQTADVAELRKRRAAHYSPMFSKLNASIAFALPKLVKSDSYLLRRITKQRNSPMPGRIDFPKTFTVEVKE